MTPVQTLPQSGLSQNDLTRAQIERRRREAEMLTADPFQAKEWLGVLAEGLSGARAGSLNREADNAETRQRADADRRFNAILASALGGGPTQANMSADMDPSAYSRGSSPAPSMAPSQAMVLGSHDAALNNPPPDTLVAALSARGYEPGQGPALEGDFPTSLIASESGGDWQAQNDAMGHGGQPGHFGRLQFGQARLEDAVNAGIIPPGTTPETFMLDPAMQQAVEGWHFDDIDRQATDLGLNAYVGRETGGVPITHDAIRAMAHLGGVDGARRFLETGGTYDPADENGTRLSDYARAHGGASSTAVNGVAGQAGIDPQMLGSALVEGLPGPPSGRSGADIALLSQMLQFGGNEFANPMQQQLIAQLSGREMAEMFPESVAPQFEFIELPGGQVVRVDKTSGSIEDLGQYGAEAPEQTALVQNLIAAGLQPGTPEFEQAVLANIGSGGNTLTVGADGAISFGPSGPGRLTEGQGKDIGFYTRGLEANSQLADLESQLTSFTQANAGLLPLGLGNYARTPEFRQAKVAADQFLTAILRKDTGAAVTPTEFSLYGPMFLPIPGDDPATIEQKRRMREVALLAIRSGLGTAESIAQANAIALGIEPNVAGAGGQGPSGGAPDVGDGTTAVNPATGERLVLRNGQWEPM